MTIPAQVFEKWSQVYDFGDAVRIHEQWPAHLEKPSLQTIRKALKTAKCRQYVYEGIAPYYQKRIEQINALTNDSERNQN